MNRPAPIPPLASAVYEGTVSHHRHVPRPHGFSYRMAQLYLDLDLSHANLPTGSRIQIGESAVIEVTAKPHNGCAKFHRRFGDDLHRRVR